MPRVPTICDNINQEYKKFFDLSKPRENEVIVSCQSSLFYKEFKSDQTEGERFFFFSFFFLGFGLDQFLILIDHTGKF